MSPNAKRLMLYVAYLVVQIGSWAFRIGILVGLLQTSFGAIGIGVAVIFAPIILGSIFLSPLVDKIDRPMAMIAVNAVRILALTPMLVMTDVGNTLSLISVAILSIVQPVYMSAQVSFLRSFTSKEEMISVLRTITNVEWLTYVIGMSTGAAILATFSLATVLVIYIGALVLSSLIIFFLRERATVSNPEAILGNTETVLDLKLLYPVFLSVFFLNFGAGVINVYPAVRATISGVTDQGTLSTIVIANGVFGLLGALTVKTIYTRLGALASMAMAAVFITLALVAMSVDGGLALATASSSLMLGLGQIFAVSAQTEMISSVPPEKAGRLSGLFQCCTYGGVALNGVLFSLIGSTVAFGSIVLMCAASAAVSSAIILVFYVVSRKTKKTLLQRSSSE
ncbi:MFS transporter [Agrobacterium vitis]|uniref:MFS transporter n=1 Tax=Agrobacterium vitis TaxID=373 RepID=UPI0012E93D22|nr:MFS transporter [Agrobacterium vitis]MVA19400.1 MFS transporter [Agrobacterium vitis]